MQLNPSSNSIIPKNLGYRRDIDGLRAIAILLVIFYHAFPSVLPSGFIGVDVFFVISGFLISGLLFKELDRGSIDLVGFYRRRVRRIFPSLLVVMSCSIGFGWVVLFPEEYAQLGKHLLGGAMFASNFVLFDESGYFDSKAETKPLLHFWSLAVEEQFYLLFPVLLIIINATRWSRVRTIILLTLISFSFSVYYSTSDLAGAYYFPQSRFWEILMGSYLAIAVRRQELSDARYFDRNLSASLGMAMLIGGLFLINKESAFPGWLALFPAMGTCLLIFAGKDAWFNRSILSSQILTWVGTISYPLYLWHWLILAFIRILNGDVVHPEGRISALVASFVLAWLTKVFIEDPLRFRMRWRGIEVLLVCLVSAIGIAGLVIYVHAGFPNRSISKNAEKAMEQLSESGSKYQRNEICQRRHPFAPADELAWWFCFANVDKKAEILFLGTSFANHFYSGFMQSEYFRNRSLLSIGACDPSWVGSAHSEAAPPRHPCGGKLRYQQQELINSIVIKDKVSYVLVGGLPDKPLQEFIPRFIKRISELEKAGAKIIVFYPHVKADFDTKSCLGRPFAPVRSDCKTKPEFYASHLRDFEQLTQSVSKSNPGVRFFNPNNVYCGENGCSFVISGLPVFKDQFNHFSDYASKLVAESFVDWAKLNMPDILSTSHPQKVLAE